MRTLPLIAATAALVGVVGVANAAPPGDGSPRPGRYTMQPTDGGFLRLDTATGDMALCARRAEAFECKPVKDDRDLQAEVARLADENKALQAEIKRLEDMLGLDGGPASGRKLQLPTEEDVDKALTYLQRMFKKFQERMKDFDAPGGGPAPPAPSEPGKTRPL